MVCLKRAFLMTDHAGYHHYLQGSFSWPYWGSHSLKKQFKVHFFADGEFVCLCACVSVLLKNTYVFGKQYLTSAISLFL